MRKGVYTLALIAFLASLAGSASLFVAEANASDVRGYIVVFKDSVQNPEAVSDELSGRMRGIRTESYRYALKGFAGEFDRDTADALARDARVDYVVEDKAVSIAVVEENATTLRDTLRATAKQNGASVSATTQTIPTGVDRINAEKKSNTGAGVNVAVVDTGIDLNHPDLAGTIVGGKNCVRGGTYQDQNGHGTHVAGIIAAQNNAFGVVGVAPGAKLWSVRVLDRYGSGTWSSVICGIDFAVSNAPKNGGPIKIINMSLGGSGSSDNNCGFSNNDPLHKAICRARDAGITVVVAAGNNAGDTAASVPAAYNDAVITVSALADSNGAPGGGGGATSYGADDTFASFSNYGTAVDVGAPGVAIRSTWLGGGYNTISGTSMASPHVAGAAALYLATHPGALWSDVRNALISLGENAGAGHTDPSLKHPEPVVRVDTL